LTLFALFGNAHPASFTGMCDGALCRTSRRGIVPRMDYHGELNMDGIEILGIAGSLRSGSFNHLALKAAQELVPGGAVLDLIELQGIPVFNQDDGMAIPAAVREFKRRIVAADAILFATPEYNYSVPGVLKNAIDWASRPYGESAWQGKPAAILGASAGHLGTARAQYHLRQVLVALNMPVVNQPEVMIGNAAQRFNRDGKLTDGPTRELTRKLLSALLSLVKANQVCNGHAG
jgi:chromate reductase